MKKFPFGHWLGCLLFSVASGSVAVAQQFPSSPAGTTVRTFAQAGPWHASAASVAVARQFPNPPAGPTLRTSAQTGPWHASATWVGGTPPSAGESVVIAANHMVTISQLNFASAGFVRVDGTLRMEGGIDTRLGAETIYVSTSGTFLIGNVRNPIKLGHQVTVTITHTGIPIDLSWDPKEMSRGVISDGTIHFVAQTKTHIAEVLNDLPANPTASRIVQVAGGLPTGWDGKHDYAIGGTCYSGSSADPEDQHFQAIAANGAAGTLTASRAESVHNHFRPAPNVPFHIVNLSRPIEFRTDPAFSSIYQRGHFMSRNGSVVLIGVLFKGFGRTDKTKPLDDVQVSIFDQNGAPVISSQQWEAMPSGSYTVTETPSAQITNQRGRYGVHFHIKGTDPASTPAEVTNCVVWGTPGWGFVNHSSYVRFIDCVAYDFAGAGFVTESGDEIGDFHGCAAIRGTGDVTNGVRSPRMGNQVTKNLERPQALGDFGFAGDGFWFQGPLISVKDCIASACSSAGLFWFTAGAVRHSINGSVVTDRYLGYLRSRLQQAYAGTSYFQTPNSTSFPRYWEDPGNPTNEENCILADLPIKEFGEFTAYGCQTGLRMRFTNNKNDFFYDEIPFDYLANHGRFTSTHPDESSITRLTQVFDSPLTLWNNERIFRGRYNENTTFSGPILAIRDEPVWGILRPQKGFEVNHQLRGFHISDITVDGYSIPVIVQDLSGSSPNNQNLRNNAVTFGTESYSNFVALDAIDGVGSNQAPEQLSLATVTQGQSGELFVTIHAKSVAPSPAIVAPAHILIRYHVQGRPDLFGYEQIATGSTPRNPSTQLDWPITLTGLESGRSYRIHVTQDWTYTSPGPLAYWSYAAVKTAP